MHSSDQWIIIHLKQPRTRHLRRRRRGGDKGRRHVEGGRRAGRWPRPRPEVGAAGGRAPRAESRRCECWRSRELCLTSGRCSRRVQARPAHVAVVMQAVDAGAEEGRVLALAARAAALVAHLVVQHVRLHLGLRHVVFYVEITGPNTRSTENDIS